MEFQTPCECIGPVEVWLNRLMESMRATVRAEITEGAVTYEENPRETWIFDYPAQVLFSVYRNRIETRFLDSRFDTLKYFSLKSTKGCLMNNSITQNLNLSLIHI